MARAIGDLVAESGARTPEEEFEIRPDYNVAPTNDIPIVLERLVTEEDPGHQEMVREIHMARWGLVPIWAKDLSFASRAFNARSETVAEKPSFRSAVRLRRAAIPVQGYYEWLAPETKGGKKQPYYVHPKDDSLMFFAGLYEWWKDPEIADGDPGQWVLSTTMLTTDSPDPDAHGVLGELGGLHDRLPVPLSRAAMDTWLGTPKLDSREDAEGLVAEIVGQAFDTASHWQMHPVSTAVGNVRNNGPELIESIWEQDTLL